MTAPVWPASLPQTPRRSSWDGGPVDLRRRFQTDGGPAIQRQGSTADVMSFAGVVFPNLSTTQRATFEAFVRDDLQRGSLPFSWADPVTGTTRLWRIEGDGTLLYRIVSKGAGLHDMTLNLICLPTAP